MNCSQGEFSREPVHSTAGRRTREKEKWGKKWKKRKAKT